MSQDFFSTSSTIVNDSIKDSVKEEIFSIPSNDFPVETNTASETMLRIESNRAIQGGDYCLKGTRITVGGIIEAMRQGHTVKDMVKALEKYWKFSISEEALKQAINEYNNAVQGLYR